MFNISNNSRSIVNILGVPIMLYGIYSYAAFPLMVLVILFFCSIEYSKLTSLINGSINKYLFLALNMTIFLNSIFNFIDMANLMILIFYLFSYMKC